MDTILTITTDNGTAFILSDGGLDLTTYETTNNTTED